MLTYIKNLKKHDINELQPLFSSKEYKIKGAHLFFISQLLASAHPDKYMVIDENITRDLKELGLTNIVVINDSVESYIYITKFA